MNMLNRIRLWLVEHTGIYIPYRPGRIIVTTINDTPRFAKIESVILTADGARYNVSDPTQGRFENTTITSDMIMGR